MVERDREREKKSTSVNTYWIGLDFFGFQTWIEDMGPWAMTMVRSNNRNMASSRNNAQFVSGSNCNGIKKTRERERQRDGQ